MKFTIGHKRVDLSDRHIKSFKTKEAFVKDAEKMPAFQNMDSDLLAAKLGEVYDLVMSSKDEAPKESNIKNKTAVAKEADK